jgi:hypothetical protein
LDFYAKNCPNNSVALQIKSTFSLDKFLFSSSYLIMPLILETGNAKSTNKKLIYF